MDEKIGFGKLGQRAKIDAYVKLHFKKKHYKTKTLIFYCDD